MTLSTQDRLEIHELYARYCHYFDAGEADRWAELYTPNATFVAEATGTAPARELRGTAELAALVRNGHQDAYAKRRIRHEITNIVVEGTETGARGNAYWMVVRVGDNQPPQVTITGRYVDELVRGADGWRFQSKRILRDV